MSEAAATRRRATTRERLLDAGRDLLAREGIHGASVEHICEHAGYTRGAFYSNFSSKDELVLALFEREFADLMRRLEVAVDPSTYAGMGPGDALSAIMDRFLQLRPPDLDFYLLHAEFQLRGMRGDIGGAEFNELWQTVTEQVGGIVQRVLDELNLRLSVPMSQVITILMGTYDTELHSALVNDRPMDEELLRVTLPGLLLAATEPAS
ncbi:TetR/AcrR family transcriptional regulator [Aeromicrobium sp. CTD01-1L150]|uniref:TetR/AcrR family transcriptional regulator n=1 Tax=Aeromicrobium sp. CTD01-1L150 TaxID=3341830 RepID=UPI0035C1567F